MAAHDMAMESNRRKTIVMACADAGGAITAKIVGAATAPSTTSPPSHTAAATSAMSADTCPPAASLLDVETRSAEPIPGVTRQPIGSTPR